MARLAQLPSSTDPREAYPRYKKWLHFAHLVEDFVTASGLDLGYLRATPRLRKL
jgi:hypothetical protein